MRRLALLLLLARAAANVAGAVTDVGVRLSGSALPAAALLLA
jgi:hypothetical protein